MSNLTGTQKNNIIGGQPIRQSWWVKAPVNAAHSTYTTTLIDAGVFPADGSGLVRVIKAGSRKHHVWNPHPKMDVTPKAVRYSIEVANGDGLFHRRSGSVWNPYGVYDAAPAECFLLHSIYVYDPAAGWSKIDHMDFIGQIVSVDYTGSASMTTRSTGTGTTAPQEAPRVAAITSEQVGAWPVLRRIFSKADAVDHTVDSVALGSLSFTAT